MPFDLVYFKYWNNGKKKYTKKEEIKGEEKNKYVCVWWEIDDEYFEGNGAQGLLKNRKSGCWRSYLVVLRSMVVNVIDRESGFNVVGGGARWFGVGGAVFGPVGDGRNQLWLVTELLIYFNNAKHLCLLTWIVKKVVVCWGLWRKCMKSTLYMAEIV